MRASNSWDKITISQFVNINNINDSDLDLLDKQTEITAILYNTTTSNIEDLGVNEYKEAVQIIKNLDKPFPTEPKQVFKVNGKTYRFMHEINKWSWGQWISVMELLKDKTHKEVLENLARLLSIVCVPMKRNWRGKLVPCKFDGYKVSEIEQEFYDHLTMDVANPISVFFYALSTNLTVGLQDYFVEVANKKLKEAQEILSSERLAG